MNEHELKSALQEVMVASSPPPPMSPEAALEHGRRARRRRKAAVGGGFAGLAVVAIAVGAAAVVPNPTGGGADLRVAAGQSAESRPSVTPTAGALPAPGDGKASTETPWPSGQTDRTATSGPRADKSAAVLNDLISSLPTGVEAEDKIRIGQDQDYGPMTRTQSQFVEYVGDLEVWEYLAYTPVVRTGQPGVGHLWIQVETKGATRFPDRTGCDLVVGGPQYPVAPGGRCEVVQSDGKVAVGPGVAIVTAEGAPEGMEQAAFYRHADGTVVIVAQSRAYANSGHPALAELPLTSQQLAAIAANPEFRLD